MAEVAVPFPWFRTAATNGMIVDTGVLLLHAFSIYEQGRYLGRVLSDIPSPQAKDVVDRLDELMRAFRVNITPQVLAEFQALAERRGRFSEEQVGDLLLQYSLFPLGEMYVPRIRLQQVKTQFNAWRFSYTDTSLVLAAQAANAPLLTTDRALRRLGNRLNVLVLHVYEDYYLHL